MKKNLPLIVIIASTILIIVNFIMSDEIDRGFWMSTLSSVLIIIAMISTIKANKKKEEN
ncbi:hypothetical protein [Winogradskyella undariae]|uniref:hypothetical protein n=1 Tax=Winogradskyella undariae TaxID=1285465 RepID=UPI0015CACAC6|nr:hypothetical protein [Winogradskyella undariae]